MIPSIAILREHYFIRGIHRTFATGRRKELRYVLPCRFGGYSKVNVSGPDPDEYLEFAKADLEIDSLQAGTNAVSNAKRAVHLAVDGVLNLLGLAASYGRRNFPDKLRILERFGAVPTRVVASMNKRRNILEHEYELVDREEAETLVEGAELFLMATYPYLREAVLGVYASRGEDERCLEITVDPVTCTATEAVVDAPYYVETEEGAIHVNITSKAERTVLTTVDLTRENENDWLPYLDLFAYCTRRREFSLPGDGPPGHFKIGHSTVDYPKESGLAIAKRAG